MEDFIPSGMPWKIFNFVIFVGLLYFLLKKGVSQFWATRRSNIEFQLNESRQLLRQAEARNQQMTGRLGRMEQEVAELMSAIRKEGELEKKRIIENSERQARQLREGTKRIIDQEFVRAQESIKQDIVRIAVQLADRVVREKFGTADQQRLSEMTLKSLEGEP